MNYRLTLTAMIFVCAGVFAQPPKPPSPLPPPAPMPGEMPAKPAEEKMAEPEAPTETKPIEWPKEVRGKTLEQWIEELNPRTNKDATLREVACKVMPSFGPAAQKAVPALTRAVKDPDPGVRIAAMVILTGMSLEDEKEVQLVSDAMKDVITYTSPGSAMRLHAARSLTALGPAAYNSSTMGSLIRLAEDPWWETRQAAAAAMGRVGMAIFEEKDKDAPPGTIVVPKREADKTAMKKLIYYSLKDDSATVRLEATQSLITLGPPWNPDPRGYAIEAKEFVDAINYRVKFEKDTNILIWLYLILMMYDDREFEVGVPVLAKYTNDPELTVRVQALQALSVLGPKAAPAMDEILQGLHQPEDIVVLNAVSCLVAMGSEAKDALPQLERLKTEQKEKELTAKEDNEKENAKQMVKLVDRAITAIKDAKDPPKPVGNVGVLP